MTRLIWDQPSDRMYETGVGHGVLYPSSDVGIVWNGLVSVQETVSGGDSVSYYFDGLKYFEDVLPENFEATIEAFSAPKEFANCDGSRSLAPGLYAKHQPRTPFGMTYRTEVGSASNGPGYGYKIHIVYNAVASPSAENNRTHSNTPTPKILQWSINAIPVPSSIMKPTAHFVVDSVQVSADKLITLEDVLYGTTPSGDIVDGGTPSVPATDSFDGGTPSGTGTDILDGGGANILLGDPPRLPTLDELIAILL